MKSRPIALIAILQDFSRESWYYVKSTTDERCRPMYDIPKTGFLRLRQVLSLFPVGKTTWWEGVKSGRYPQGVKLSPRCTAWRAEDIRMLLSSISCDGRQ